MVSIETVSRFLRQLQWGALWNETLYKKGTVHKTEYSSAVTGRISMKKSSLKSLCSNGAS
jgi:hypothetical protein